MNSSLNHVYRIIWNATLGLWQVASEATRGRGKTGSSQQARKARRALAAATAMTLVAPAAWAVLPTGGTVVAGSATINQAGSALNITQSSDKAAIDWQSFSIGQGNSVNFVQPSTTSVALNRVLGNDVSVIQGAINANGQVFLVNQNGVLFTPTAQVNVGGIVASTQNISTADFMAGKYEFSGNSTATVENQGSITAANGGVVALVAAKVINSGTITAPQGTVGLAAGNTVLLDLGGPVKIQVTEGALNAAIEQSGGIRADGGTIYLTAKAAGNLAASVINHSGVTRALTMASLTGEQGQTGSIALSADQINNTGTLDVSGLLAGQHGGDILAQGKHYTDSGTTLADGAAQGGNIDVRATNITQTQGAKVSASSSDGQGGRIEMIGDLGNGRAEFAGQILATGRRRGGFVDTSGAKLLIKDTLRVNTSSSEGQTGEWLLDPVDFTIAASGGDLTGAALSTALQNSNITIQTLNNPDSVSCASTGASIVCGAGSTRVDGGDIHVNDTINGNASTTLTLQASRDININKTVTVGGLNLTAVRNVNVKDVVTVNNNLAVNYGANRSGNVFTPNTTVRPSDTAALNMSLNSAGFTGKINLGANVTSVKLNDISHDIIRDRAGLAAVANGLTSNYVLAGDIDLGGIEWVPLGDTASTTAGGFFGGRVEGLGHQVTNLSINSTSGARFNAGLFGLVGDGTLTNLGVSGKVDLINANQAAAIYAGGLAGQVGATSGTSPGTRLRNVFSSVDVTVSNTRPTLGSGNAAPIAIAGGLLGQTARGTLLTNAYAIGVTRAISTIGDATAGGLIGSILSATTVSSVYASGNVTATGGDFSTSRISRAGGLIGNVGSLLTLEYAYATGNVRVEASSGTNPNMRAGGLIGDISGGSAAVTVNSVFASGAVATGASMASRIVGGLVGSITNNSGVTKTLGNAYWDSTKTGQTNAVGSITGTGAAGVSVSATQVPIGTAGTTYSNLVDTKWGFSGGTPYLLAIPMAVTNVPIFIRLNCGTLCFNTYGDTLPTFVFDDFAAANGTTPLTNATLTGTATFNVTDANNNAVSGFSSLSNAGTYKFVYTGGLMASGFELVAGDAVTWTVVKRELTATLQGTTANPLTKTYDGNANLAINAANVSLGNFAHNQGTGATLLGISNAIFNSPDVLQDNTVTADMTSASLALSNGALASNYVLPSAPITAAGSITPRALTVALQGTTANPLTKVYNGNANLALSSANFLLGNFVGEQGTGAALNGITSGTFNDANVLQANTVTASLTGSTLALAQGVKASNYSLSTEPVAAAGTITAKAVQVTGLKAQSKEYNGLLNATITGTATVASDAFIQGDDVSVSGNVTGGVFTSKDAGTDIAVSVTGLSLTGNEASNYQVTAPGLKANITPKALTIADVSVADKAYDGNRTASVTAGALSGLVTVGGVTESLGSTTATGQFASKDVTRDANGNVIAQNVAVTYTLANGAAQGEVPGAKASNYTLAGETKTAKITPKALTVTSTVADKTYDGSAAATVTVGTVSGVVAGEQLGLTTATGSFVEKDVARDANGNVIAKNVSVAYTLANGVDTQTAPIIIPIFNLCMTFPCTSESSTTTIPGTLISGAKASNYSLASETKTAKITPKALAISGSSVTNKQYDGGVAATVTAGTLSGFVTVDGETEALGNTTATGTFSSQNASPELQSVTAVYTLANGSNPAHKAGNYSLANEVLTGKITQRVLTMTGSTVTGRDYDGTKTATVVVGTLGNLVGDETLGTTTASGTFADKDAGKDKNVSVAYTLVDGMGSFTTGAPIPGTQFGPPVIVPGTLASNYTLANETLKGSIAQKAVTVSGIVANGKTYDGNTTATLSNQGTVTTGVSGESLAVTTTGSFDKKNAGTRTVNTTTTIAGTGDTLASNYSLSNAANTVTATIAQKALNIAATAINKVYDGKSTATATLSSSDIVTNDKVTLNQTAANFVNAQGENDKNVGKAKTVKVTGLSLSGDDALNYKLNNEIPVAQTTADITAKSLSITTTASDKVYNASTAATVTLSTTDKVEGDVLTLNKTVANFDTKNVGTGKTVTVDGLSLGGADAGNYAISNANAKATDTADISKAALSVSGITAANKTYDGTANATVSVAKAVLGGLFEGDKLSVSATGSFANKTAETGKTVTLTSTYSGADVDNYNITNQASTKADISQLAGVKVIADKQSKNVGAADPALTFSVTGLLAGDALQGALTREVGEAAGLYDITQGSLGNENYLIDEFTSAQLTISQPIADVAIANAQTLEPKLDLPQEREALEERSGDVAPFILAANQVHAQGPAQLTVVKGGIKLPAGLQEEN